MLRLAGPFITCSLALASTSAIAQAGATPPSASGEKAAQRTEGRVASVTRTKNQAVAHSQLPPCGDAWIEKDCTPPSVTTGPISLPTNRISVLGMRRQHFPRTHRIKLLLLGVTHTVAETTVQVVVRCTLRNQSSTSSSTHRTTKVPGRWLERRKRLAAL